MIIDLKKGWLIINELFQIAKSMDLSGLVFYENERNSLIILEIVWWGRHKRNFWRVCVQQTRRRDQSMSPKLKNLNILSDVVTQTGTNFLKNIMNLWKNFLMKEYDQNTVLMSFSNGA